MNDEKDKVLEGSHNNGGKTDYYDLKPEWECLNDLFEGKGFDDALKCLFLGMILWEEDGSIQGSSNIAKLIKTGEDVSDSYIFQLDQFEDIINKPLEELYGIPVKQCNDFIDGADMRFNIGEAFKVLFCWDTGRHTGSDSTREMNKIVYYLDRERLRQSLVYDDILQERKLKN